VVNARSQQTPARAGRLRTFSRVAICSSLLGMTLLAMAAPNARTTWLDAWAGSVGIGLVAGLLALCVAWARRQGKRGLLDFLAGLAAASLLAGFLRGRHRIF
jgi:hypothetical protein